MTKEIGLQTRHTEEALRLSGNINGKTVKVAGIDLSGLYGELLVENQVTLCNDMKLPP